MINRKYKDSVFRMLFGSAEYKENTLALYNAMNGSSYTDAGVLELNTIEDVIYMGVKNDVSFIVGDEMNLWEHQSTFNPNMPLRGLTYFARLYQGYIERNGLSVFSKKALTLPTPRYIIFYIGKEVKRDEIVLRLSDSFTGSDPSIEVTATMININRGHSEVLMKACRILEEYSTLIHEIRERQKEAGDKEEAVKAAVNHCIAEGILKGFLLKNKSEVTDMFLTEFNEEEYRALLRREAREEGLEEGRAEGREEGLAEGREEGLAEGQAQIVRHLSCKGKTEFEIAELTGLPQERVHSLLCG